MTTNTDTHTYWLGQIADGTYISVSVEAPKFCFNADSLEAVEAITRRALDAYFGDDFHPVKRTFKETRISELRPIKAERFTRAAA